MNYRTPHTRVHPFLKWAGGKGQLLTDLLQHVPATLGTYYEPFVGGGALFFELMSRGRITKACLSDINQPLIDAYTALRDCVDDVISLLRQHTYNRDYYYKIRALHPQTLSLPERAARIIYLNKTCYNGLYRENRAGQFNVPFGSYKNPIICDEPNLRAISKLLQGVSLTCRPYTWVLEEAVNGDFVYFDPPYQPVSPTSSFTAYDRNGFGEADQTKLRDVFTELTERSVFALLSNSDTPFIRKLYKGYKTSRVYATRAINSKSHLRGKVAEVIISNCKDAVFVQHELLEKKARPLRAKAHTPKPTAEIPVG